MFLLPRCGNSARITREGGLERERGGGKREEEREGEHGVLKINFAWNLIYVHDDDFLA